MAGRTVAETSEFDLIDSITAGLPTGAAVRIGPGDDCAVFGVDGDVAVSTDTMVENVHFRRAWSAPNDVGRKAVAAAVADLEAMGARPIAVVLALTIPAELELAWVADFNAGVREECTLSGALLLGGDITRGRDITITATVVGDLQGRPPVTRSGARPGDVVALCGRLGWAAAGLTVLNRGFRSPRAVVVAHRVPEPPYGQGIVAQRAGASAMIDCSDGLLADLGHIAEASRVAIDVETSRLDVAEPQSVVAAAVGGGDPLTFILTGGDDHALLATFAPADVPDGWRVIGTVADGDPAVTVDGATWEGGAAGWQHF
ncbi:MAG: thiamine-phosphate kinase [Micropruina sp.]|uniref:thiamine-phosphate kinase n=1 Tax=Micropruina sp. TaxID=2737536 RepID=UPI0039E66901